MDERKSGLAGGTRVGGKASNYCTTVATELGDVGRAAASK